MSQISPVRPINADIIVAGPGGSDYTAWPYRSYPGNATGFILQQVNGQSTPASIQQIYVGFNKQPPVLMNVRDAIRTAQEFATVEVYNNLTIAIILYAVVFNKCKYIPCTNPASFNTSGLIYTAITSEADLATLPTSPLTTGTIILFVDSATLQLVAYQLRLDVAGTPAAGKVVPLDWTAINDRSWYQVL